MNTTEEERIKAGKVTKKEMNIRVRKAFDFLYVEPVKNVNTALMNEYQVSDSTAYRYMSKARDLYTNLWKKDADKLVQLQKDMLIGIYNRAVKAEDIKSQLAVVKELSLLMGINSPTRKEVKKTVEVVKVTLT